MPTRSRRLRRTKALFESLAETHAVARHLIQAAQLSSLLAQT